MGISKKIGAKAGAAFGIAAAIFGGGADKAKDSFAKGQDKERKAKVERIMDRRRDANSSRNK